MLAVRWSVLLFAVLGARCAFAEPGPPTNYQGRIRANDAPLAGRLTITAYFLDSLDDSLDTIHPELLRSATGSPMAAAGRWLLLRFHDSNGKNAFVVPTDLAMSGNHRSSYRMELVPVGRSRVGGHLDKDETRWALWWVPQGQRQLLNWENPGDLTLQYGFNKTPFMPLSSPEMAQVLKLVPWPALKSAALDSTVRTDRTAVDAAAFDQPPVPKLRRDPPYPSSAKMYDFHGSLFVAAHVNPSGLVEDAYVLQSDAVHDLNVAALVGVMEWTFKPGLKSGQPVAGDFVIPIKFDLGSVK
jgi:TonB family protein